MKQSICTLLGIKLPIISGGMVWCSGHKLASAVSMCGGLGLIGAGSMHPETLRIHIQKAKATLGNIPFGVNIPLFYPELETLINILTEEKVPVVVTSGGNPSLYTKRLKDTGAIVLHVIASVKFAKKAAEAGVDGVIAEGFEAGGHNGRDELPTMVLTPMVAQAVDIPVIAAGGVAQGCQWLAAEALGANGVQIGSLFAMSEESSAHQSFKELCLTLGENSTHLSLKSLSPVRLIKNEFFNQVNLAENRGAQKEEIAEILGRGRAKKGIFEGDLVEGELEIGQNVAMINTIKPIKEIMETLVNEYNEAKNNLNK